MQAEQRVVELRKQELRSSGAEVEGDGESDNEDEGGDGGGYGGGFDADRAGGGEGARLLDADGAGGPDVPAFAIDHETGEVAWAALAESLQGNVAHDTADDADDGPSGVSLLHCFRRSGKGGSWRLPAVLLVFLLPCVALAPFYASVYATTTSAVDSVLEAQVRARG